MTDTYECPTCHSTDPAVRGHQHENGTWDCHEYDCLDAGHEEAFDCPDPSHDLTGPTPERMSEERHPMNPPPWFKWEVIDKTTNSGKQLFRCSVCGQEQPWPDKWQYHADVCFMNVTAELTRLRERVEELERESSELLDAQDALVDAELVRMVTQVVRDADMAFEQSGGSSRHWVREQFLPKLDDAGLAIVTTAAPRRRP